MRIKEISKYLPGGWEAKSKELGAMVRGREIKTAEELLELNMLYLTGAGSFGATATLLNLTTQARMTKKAVYTRIQNSWAWLRWITQEMCKENEFVMPKPEWLGERNVIAIDASTLSVKGSKQGDYRLHTAFNLFEFQCRTLEITSIKEGEKLTRHVVEKGDIQIGDRVYGTIASMEHVLENDGNFILRYRTKAFKLYNENGENVDIASCCNQLKEKESLSMPAYYCANGKKKPVRIVAMRKTKEDIETAHRKMGRKMKKQRGSSPSKEALDFNQYIVLVTSLDYSNNQILELYRARWQIEQVFFRLKSMYGFGEIPSKKEDTVKAWFYGKLFIAVLAETILKRECFSPEEEKLAISLGLV